MAKKYSEEIKEFIKKNAPGTPVRTLIELTNNEFRTNFTYTKMKSFLKNHNIKTGTTKGNPKGYSRIYTQEIKQFILDNYKGVGPKEMTELINKTFGTSYTVGQLKSYYSRNKLNSGITGYFEQGHTPWNKGRKGEYYKGCEKTWFSKGHIPANYRPVGSERITKDGYTEVKVADPNKWRLKHNIIWEQHNGPIPKGHVVIFGDGDKTNFNINNLILVSRAQLARLNQNRLIQNDADLTRTGIIIADLISKIAEKSRQNKDMKTRRNRNEQSNTRIK